ncbi:MAG: hypothetical protein ACREEC_13445, partial [Thermoplasmata archaeon]
TGKIAFYNGGPGATQVSISVDGWFTNNSNPSATGGLYYPNNGTLVCDTIDGTGGGCSAGQKLDAARLQGPDPLSVQIAGLGGVPQAGSDLIGVELSLTVTHEQNVGNGTYVCVYASNSSCQEADLNLYGGVPANLLVIVPLGPDGKVDVYTPTGSMDVLIAVTGYYMTDPGAFTTISEVGGSEECSLAMTVDGNEDLQGGTVVQFDLTHRASIECNEPAFGLTISNENFSGSGVNPPSYGSPNPATCTACDAATTVATATCAGFCNGSYIQYAHFVVKFPSQLLKGFSSTGGQYGCSETDPFTVTCDGRQYVPVPSP